ncbi:hypothetical protein ACFX13_012807 [Malus domestica]
MPASLSKVDNPQIKQVMEKCLVPVSMQLSAVEVMKDPILEGVQLFEFYLESDTVISIAGRWLSNLMFHIEDVSVVAELIDNLIVKLVPGWKPSSELSLANKDGYGELKRELDAIGSSISRN